MRRWLIILATIVVVADFAGVDAAQAGVMVVYSCHSPSGHAASTSGWALRAGGPDSATSTWDTCSSSAEGSLRLFARAPYSEPSSDDIYWAFSPALNTTVTAFRASVCSRAERENSTLHASWASPREVFDERTARYAGGVALLGCVGPPPYWGDSRNAIAASGLVASQIRFGIRCEPATCPADSRIGDVQIASFRAEIRDDFPPTASDPHGSLIANSTHFGTEALAFRAADSGVGLFRSVAEIRLLGVGGWQEIAQGPLGSSPWCASFGEIGDAHEFQSPQPCPLSATTSLSINNDALGRGDHQLRVVIEDAAGNRSEVVAPHLHRVIDTPVPPRPAVNGDRASRSAQLRLDPPSAHALSASRIEIAGRLLDESGSPIAGASIGLRTRGLLPRSGTSTGVWQEVHGTLSDAQGDFHVSLARGASRTLEATYVANPLDPAPSATAQIDIRVPGQLTVRAQRAVVRNNQSAIFRGRVTGAIPAGGVLVALEARGSKGWIPAATTRRWVRTSSSGAFRLSYRFRHTFRPTSYKFRVVVDEDSAFAYSRGISRTITVSVRP